jgi:hypothetical protein
VATGIEECKAMIGDPEDPAAAQQPVEEDIEYDEDGNPVDPEKVKREKKEKKDNPGQGRGRPDEPPGRGGRGPAAA